MCEGNVKLMKKYNKAMQDAKANIYMLNNWIEDALQLNKDICYILLEINGTNDIFCCSKTVNLSGQSNVKLLHIPEELESKVNLKSNPHIVKQRSNMWFELRKEARITGSTIYKGIRLETLKLQKDHYSEFIEKIEPKEFPPDME